MIRILLSLMGGLLAATNISAGQPTGNMVAAGEYVLWAYIDPVDNPEHKASVMGWKEGSEPEVIMRSEFPASEFMLFSRKDSVWIIERRPGPSEQVPEVRMLRMKMGGEPFIIRDWIPDDHGLGNAGFFVDTDGKIVFAANSRVYRLTAEGKAEEFFSVTHDVSRLRHISTNTFLLLGDSDVWLTDRKGNSIKKWSSLTDEAVTNAPLGRNMIVDADYHDGELLLAYWGGRKFIHIDKQGNRHSILPLEKPMVPHWVLFFKKDRWLFSSLLIMNDRPRPDLEMISPDGKKVTIWKKFE